MRLPWVVVNRINRLASRDGFESFTLMLAAVTLAAIFLAIFGLALGGCEGGPGTPLPAPALTVPESPPIRDAVPGLSPAGI